MRYYFIQFIKLLFSTTLFWSAAFCLYITIRYFAIGAEEGLEITDFSFINLLKYGLYLGVLIGLLYAIVEFVFDKFIIKNLSLAVILLIIGQRITHLADGYMTVRMILKPLTLNQIQNPYCIQ